MNDSQNSIYYLTGEIVDILKTSPQLEIFKNKNIEVILLTDPVDEFWISSVGKYKEHEFKSVMISDNELDSIQNKNNSENTPSDSENDDKNDNILNLVAIIKETLGSEVKDVKTSSRLVGSPVCLVGEEGGMSLHMERMMKQQGQSFTNPRILEINPKHSLIIKCRHF